MRKYIRIKNSMYWLFGIYKIYLHKLKNDIKNNNMPIHIALILDGNRRWAKNNDERDNEMHKIGADIVEDLLDWCNEFKIKIVTLYVLSIENLHRDKDELNHIYELIKNKLEKLYHDPNIHAKKMRIKVVGRIELLPKSIKNIIQRLDDATKGYDGYFLNIALAYGGQDEIVDAMKNICRKIKKGMLDINDINKQEIEASLYTSHLPQSSPDIVLRTSGEKRLSDFLVWQSAYSELVFIDIFWPEFKKSDLIMAIRTFQKRKRRFGR